ncbi:hypothetical protein BISA_2330 [Bifidobacterium saguini DSM 23967]|uniref:Molecular chaperone n=2 Tax=Bifidobacterium saguini TaxID=762210 RepID=A0A087D253_9BIFI|nr:hypothetical protein [Bifidobacterium saguini]KFI89603.1 hypothetical protein BISA_2330 [Bifidobacterium saguini DSM 23967]QTB90713.1 hypothetical protein BSD967_10535 [Bifidobacterium saguini]
MNASDPWELGPIIPGADPVIRIPAGEESTADGDDAGKGSRVVASDGVKQSGKPDADPWEIGPLPSSPQSADRTVVMEPVEPITATARIVLPDSAAPDTGDSIESVLESVSEPAGFPDDFPNASPSWNMRRIAIMAVVLVAVSLTVPLAGFAWHAHESAVAAKAVEEAAARCETARETAVRAADGLDGYLAGERFGNASKVTAGQVEDPRTVAALRKITDGLPDESEPLASCDAESEEALEHAEQTLKAIADRDASDLRKLRKAVGKVLESRLARTRAEAEELYSSSEGKVADDSSRATLREAIDASDETAMTKAMSMVRESIDAKNRADAEAAAAESRTDPQPSAGQPAQQGQTRSQSNGGSSWRSGSSGSSTGSGSQGSSGSPDWSVPSEPDPSQFPDNDPGI